MSAPLDASKRPGIGGDKKRRYRKCLIIVIVLVILLALLFGLLAAFVFIPLARGRNGSHGLSPSNLVEHPKRTEPISFDSNPRLSIIQRFDNGNLGSRGNFGGVVTVQPAASGSSSSVDLEVSSTTGNAIVGLEFDKAAQEVRIVAPRHSQDIWIRATFWVDRCLELLRIDTIPLDIQIKEGLLPCLSPNSANLTTLDIRSTSGDLSVKSDLDGVAGLNSDKQSSLPDYIVRMKTTSGAIAADITTGSEAQFNSTSGNINLRLLPVLNSNYLESKNLRPFFRTQTLSGGTILKLLDPIWTAPRDRPPVFSILDSSHFSTSGNMKLICPSSWEGKVSSRGASGRRIIRGKDLSVSNGRSRLIEGQRGNGGSTLKIETTSGDQDVLVGQE